MKTEPNKKLRLVNQLIWLMKEKKLSKIDLAKRTGLNNSHITMVFKDGYGSQLAAFQTILRSVGADLFVRELPQSDIDNMPDIWDEPLDELIPDGRVLQQERTAERRKQKKQKKATDLKKWDLKKFGV